MLRELVRVQALSMRNFVPGSTRCFWLVEAVRKNCSNDTKGNDSNVEDAGRKEMFWKDKGHETVQRRCSSKGAK